MNSKVKSNSVISTSLRNDNGEESVSIHSPIIRFTVAGAGHIDLHVAKLSDTIRRHAMMHGLIQRISDRAAIAKDTTTGKPVPPTEKLAAMETLAKFYMEGGDEWAMQRSGVGTSEAKILSAALARAYPHHSPEKIATFLKGKSATEQRQLLNSDKIRPFADEIRAEMAKEVDVTELLNELDELEEECGTCGGGGMEGGCEECGREVPG